MKNQNVNGNENADNNNDCNESEPEDLLNLTKIDNSWEWLWKREY